MNQIKLVFNMIWLMEILKIQQKKAASDRVLRYKAFNIAKNPKYDANERGLVSMDCKFFEKKSSGGGVNNEIKQNKQLTEELYKPIIKKKVKKKSLFFM